MMTIEEFIERDEGRLPVRFGHWHDGAGAGVACLGLYYGRTGTNTSVGFRPAYIS